MLAGAVGIEPTVHGIKSRCLTTWLRPITFAPLISRGCGGKIRGIVHIRKCEWHKILSYVICGVFGGAHGLENRRGLEHLGGCNPPIGMVLGQGGCGGGGLVLAGEQRETGRA